jgi:NAD(P)H-hydrate epimerase
MRTTFPHEIDRLAILSYDCSFARFIKKMKVLTAAQMQQVDRWSTERYHIPGLLLMETAGSNIVTAIEQHFGPLSVKHVKIFCGKGNNGGDGAVIARHLWLRGAIVELFLLGKLEDTRGDARINFEIIKKLAAVEMPQLAFQEIEMSEELHDILIEPCDLYVDALFGTGGTRPLTGLYKELVEQLNESATPIVAVDLPSGLNADNPNLIGPTIKAQLTVTMTAAKLANVLPPGMHYNGNLVVVPIGSPATLIPASGSNVTLVDAELIEHLLARTRRSPAAHKNMVGNVLLIAGSLGKTGAATLAATATLRAGAGLVTVATPQSAQPTLAASSPAEIMTLPLAETSTGTLSATALAQIMALADKKQIIGVGPGLGTNDDTRKFMRGLLDQPFPALIIDADGLNSLSPWPDKLNLTPDRPVILTPHIGEMARLAHTTNEEAAKSRLDLARRFAQQHQVIVVLKGERTLIAAPNGELYINPTGNAGMATAGSGDVLAGLIAGLIAQLPQISATTALQATLAAVYLHGLAGDLAAKTLGQRSLLAGDLIQYLAAAILTLGGEFEKRNIFDPFSRRDF